MIRSLVGAGISCSIWTLKEAAEIIVDGDKVKILKLKDLLKPLELTLGLNEEYDRKLLKEFIKEGWKYFRPSKARKFLVF